MATREPSRPLHLPTLRELVGELAVLAAIALVLAALGPFGSFALGNFGARLAYWLPASFLGYAVFRPISLLVLTAAERLGLGELPALLVAVAVAAFPASAAMLWLGGFSFGSAVRLNDLVQLYFQVALIGGLIGAFFLLVAPTRRKLASTDEPRSPAAASSPFLDRLPPSWGRRLLALEMEDHYVRAHGPDGQSVLILMRMADAERELAGTDGARVHRSWWVMRGAVAGQRRVGRNLVLQLPDKLEAPVARDRVADLRARGWF